MSPGLRVSGYRLFRFFAVTFCWELLVLVGCKSNKGADCTCTGFFCKLATLGWQNTLVMSTSCMFSLSIRSFRTCFRQPCRQYELV